MLNWQGAEKHHRRLPDGKTVLIRRKGGHGSGRDQETRPAFPPPLRNGALWTGRSWNNNRPASGPAGAKRPPGAGRALAGGFGPRLEKGQRGAVAGAMAPAIEAVTVLSSVRAG